MAKDIKEIIVERQKIMETIRSFFAARGYLEVDVPLLVRSPGTEPNLQPFTTCLQNEHQTTFPATLITSPEYSMKKLLGKGLEAIFSVPHVFRNEEAFDVSHNPEFTLLEWYRQGATYMDCMEETEALICEVGKVFGKHFPAHKKRRVRDVFFEHTGIMLETVSREEMMDFCRSRNMPFDVTDTDSDLFYRIFLTHVEPKLGTDPIFIFDYPKHQAALSRLTPDGHFGERFELYVDGLELCNGFTELVDAKEQRRRFMEEQQERAQAGKPVHPIDEELLALLPSVTNPTYGNALGIERLHMLVTGRRRIQEVLLFPASYLFDV